MSQQDSGSGRPHSLDAASLVDPNPLALGLQLQAVHQLHGIQKPPAADSDPAEIQRRIEPLTEPHPVQPLVAVESQASGGGDGAAAVLHLRVGQGRVEPARRLVVAADAPRVQPGDHLLHVALTQVRESARLRFTEVPDRETVAVVHRLGEHPGVPPARAVGRDLPLQDHHLDAGVEFLEEERGPEPGQAGADDGDIGLDDRFECRDLSPRALGEPVTRSLDGFRQVYSRVDRRLAT